MNEIWKDIKDYEGLYQVSNLGRIKSLKRKVFHISGERTVNERILKQNDCTRYLCLFLSKDGKMKKFTVHRLIAETFIENKEFKPCVNHIDGNTKNNKVSNLEWCTYSENELHSYNTLSKKPPNFHKFGESNHNSKPIFQYDFQGNLINEFQGTREASRKTGINQGTLAACARGIRKTAGGYIWKYSKQKSFGTGSGKTFLFT